MFATVWIDNQDIAGSTPIRTIFGGLASEEDSSMAQKSHIRETKNTPEINKRSADILYLVAFDKIEIERERLKPTHTPLR